MGLKASPDRLGRDHWSRLPKKTYTHPRQGIHLLRNAPSPWPSQWVLSKRTISLRFPKGFTSRPYRSTDSTVFVVIEGRGQSKVGDELEVNGSTRQQGDLAQMIWSCSEIVSELSKQYRLFPGDLIYTGTPAGVGPLVPGDRVVARIHGLPELRIRIGERQR